MKNRKLLVSSFIMIISCCLLFAGTTFAWFSDSVTSNNNIITAGNLDVELEYSMDGTNWDTVDETVALFNNSSWEPGHVEYVLLKVTNAGSLALKYSLALEVTKEVGSVNVLGEAFKLSDYLVVGSLVSSELDTTVASGRSQAVAFANAHKTGFGNVNSSAELASKQSHYVQVAIVMPEEVGNEANYDASVAAAPSIEFGVNLFATQLNSEDDSFGDDYDEIVKLVSTPAEAQAALDNAVKGTTIYLTRGINYGTLYLRPVKDSDICNVVDWIGNNYRYETYTLYEDVKVVGLNGAKVDAIEIEGGTYYYTNHSQADLYPVMLSLIELKNFTVDGVTFTGKGGYDPQGHGNAIDLTGYVKVDGLTVKNCVLENPENDARLIYKTESTTELHKYALDGNEYEFYPSLANITVTDSTFNGGYMGMELRETHNLTVTNNVFNGVTSRDMLLPANTGCYYSGTVLISGNVSNYGQERFVRATSMNDAKVIITNNTLNNYLGADEDYIKVDGKVDYVIENNVCSRAIAAKSLAELQAAVNNGGVVVLTADIQGDVALNSEGKGTNWLTVAAAQEVVLDLHGHSIDVVANTTKNGNYAAICVKGSLEIVGEGRVSLTSKRDMQWGALSAVISVEGGTLVLNEGVNIVNYGGDSMAYGVDVNSTLGTTTLVINGATITSTYTAVRLFNNNKTLESKVVLNSGVVDGARRDIWAQNPSASAVDANAVVEIASSYSYEVTLQPTSFNGRIYNFN